MRRMGCAISAGTVRVAVMVKSDEAAYIKSREAVNIAVVSGGADESVEGHRLLASAVTQGFPCQHGFPKVDDSALPLRCELAENHLDDDGGMVG